MKSTTLSLRVPRELKERMDKLRNRVNWSEEIRRFIEKRVAEEEQREAVLELDNLIRKIVKPSPPGTAAKLVREDRESH